MSQIAGCDVCRVAAVRSPLLFIIRNSHAFFHISSPYTRIPFCVSCPWTQDHTRGAAPGELVRCSAPFPSHLPSYPLSEKWSHPSLCLCFVVREANPYRYLWRPTSDRHNFGGDFFSCNRAFSRSRINNPIFSLLHRCLTVLILAINMAGLSRLWHRWGHGNFPGLEKRSPCCSDAALPSSLRSDPQVLCMVLRNALPDHDPSATWRVNFPIIPGASQQGNAPISDLISSCPSLYRANIYVRNGARVFLEKGLKQCKGKPYETTLFWIGAWPESQCGTSDGPNRWHFGRWSFWRTSLISPLLPPIFFIPLSTIEHMSSSSWTGSLLSARFALLLVLVVAAICCNGGVVSAALSDGEKQALAQIRLAFPSLAQVHQDPALYKTFGGPSHSWPENFDTLCNSPDDGYEIHGIRCSSGHVDEIFLYAPIYPLLAFSRFRLMLTMILQLRTVLKHGDSTTRLNLSTASDRSPRSRRCTSMTLYASHPFLQLLTLN